MEFINDPSQTDSDRPDYAKMRGPVNCRKLADTGLNYDVGSEGGGCPTSSSVTSEEIDPGQPAPPVINHSNSGVGSEGGGCPTSSSVTSEQIDPGKPAPPVINHPVPNTKVEATAATVETAQADEPIEERNVVTTESAERDKENERVARAKVLSSEGVNFFDESDTSSGSEESDEESSESEGSDEENEGVAGAKVLSSEGVNSSESEESDEENEGVAGAKVLSSEGVNRSESEESDEENEGQANILGMLVQAFWIPFAAALRLIKAAKFVINIGVLKVEMPLEALWRDN